MNLTRKDFEFVNPRICEMQPKYIDLDRVMIGLYMLLKYDGRRPVAKTGRREVTVQNLVSELITQHLDTLPGFQSYSDVVEDWVYSDLVDMVFRGHPDKERVASPRPLHLNAYKLRNPKYSKDYRAPEHLFSMIRAGDPALVGDLAEYLGKGMDASSRDTYDGRTELDLDTLMIVRMVDNELLNEKPSGEGAKPERPLCLGQARLLCNDLRRLLAYENLIPRPVLIEYLRTAFGLHLGLYLLRLFNQLCGWVADKRAHPTCLNCPVRPDESDDPFRVCPYAFQNPEASGPFRVPEILVDMGESPNSHMAGLSRENSAAHYGRINDYIYAVLLVNQIFRFADSMGGQSALHVRPTRVEDAVDVLADPPARLDTYFEDRISDILPGDEAEKGRPEISGIKNMVGLSPLETFVELVALDKTRYYRKYLTEQLDSVLMKNTATGLLRQGKGKNNERRWHLASRMLEMLVQIAVLEPVGGAGGRYRARPILVDDFVKWMSGRYGLSLAPRWPDATIQDYQAFNENLGNLKQRLREIGFYTDLSDAYNAQVIRPRYSVEYEAL